MPLSIKTMKNHSFSDFLPLIILLITLESVSFAIGWSTAPQAGGWYDSLIKSEFTPPGWVFGVVWPTLYAFMAMAVWLVWKKRSGNPAKTALALFALHLPANWAWNFVFFEFQMIPESFYLLMLICFMVAFLTVLFFRTSKTAGFLMIPYYVWVCFAVFLSGYIWMWNPS